MAGRAYTDLRNLARRDSHDVVVPRTLWRFTTADYLAAAQAGAPSRP